MFFSFGRFGEKMYFCKRIKKLYFYNKMRKILILTIMVVATLTVSAQSKWQYTFSLGGEYKSGNVNTFTFNNKGGVERNDSILALDANYAIVYGQKDRVEYDKSLTGNLTFDIWQYNRVSPFVSATYYNNKYKGFEYKLSFLAGAKYRLFYNQNYDYSISAAYVYEYVDYFTTNTTILEPQVSRVSLRFKMRHKLNEGISLKHITFYMPSITNLGDYIVTSSTSLSSQLGKHLFLDLNFNYEYHSLVPDNVQKQDIITSVTLRMKF